MPKNEFDTHKVIPLQALAEATSPVIAGDDKRVIFRRLLNPCVTDLGAGRV
jgi:hypothetical protein